MTGRREDITLARVDIANIHLPETLYRELRSRNATQIHFLPTAVGAARILPEQWGDFLNRVYAVWVREDVDTISVQLFDTTLSGWCGMLPCRGSSQLKCQRCPGRRICTADNNDLLCEGYLAFYRYSAPFMKVMRDLLKQNRPKNELMALLRQQ